MVNLKTDQTVKLREKLSLRMLILVLLIVLYALMAIWLGSSKWQIAALVVPAGVVGLLASIRRMLSPYAITTFSLLTYGCVLLAFGLPAETSSILVTLVHVGIMIVTGLVLSEIQIMATASRAEEDALKHADRVISLTRLQRSVAEELRRSRRYDLPMSLVLFRVSADSASAHSRSDLINAVSSATREFDQLFSLSRSELGVLCTDTDRAGALKLVARIQQHQDLEHISISSFPEDAVTSTALIDVLKTGTKPIPQRELAAVAD